MQEWDPRLGVNNYSAVPSGWALFSEAGPGAREENVQGVIKGRPVLISTKRLTLSAPAPRAN